MQYCDFHFDVSKHGITKCRQRKSTKNVEVRLVLNGKSTFLCCLPTKLDKKCVWKDLSKALHHSKSQRTLIGKLVNGFAVQDEQQYLLGQTTIIPSSFSNITFFIIIIPFPALLVYNKYHIRSNFLDSNIPML